MANNEVNEPYVPYGKPATFEQVWRMFQETDRMLSEKFEETDKQLKETDRMLTEKFNETDKQFKETREMFKDTDKRFQDTDKKIKELSNLFTTQWGKLVESLVEGDLVNVLNRWGINVERTLQRVKGNRNGENFEYDIIAVNGEEIVIVEVKTTLRVQDVNWFHEKLYKAKQFMPEYKERKIYGAVAFISSEGASDRMAENTGLFVIKATGNSSAIVNKADFKPKAF